MPREITPATLVPLPASNRPALFGSWDETLHMRAFELWATLGNRDAARTHRLLQHELGRETPLPAAATIREWARVEAWAARADADLHQSHGKTLFQLQCGWLAGVQLAQAVLLDGMSGAFDGLPLGGAPRIKSAEIVLRTLERANLLAALPQRPEPEQADDAHLTDAELHQRAMERLREIG